METAAWNGKGSINSLSPLYDGTRTFLRARKLNCVSSNPFSIAASYLIITCKNLRSFFISFWTNFKFRPIKHEFDWDKMCGNDWFAAPPGSQIYR